MSTHATIAVVNSDGTVDAAFCHFDGYLEGVGRTLAEHYASPEKAGELVSLGGFSSLDSTPATIQTYDEEPFTYESVKDFEKSEDNCEWTYVFTSNNEWLVRHGGPGNRFSKLKLLLEAREGVELA